MEFARRNKSFLSFLVAVFVLLMTYMSINSGLAYNSGIDDEIGVPVVPSAGKGRFVDAAFMAPDGKHFYTLREGLLTKFSINPFQKVSSYEIDFKEILSAKNFFKVFIALDEKRLFISNNKKHQVSLVDIPSGDIIRHIVINEDYDEIDLGEKKLKIVTNGMIDAVMNNREFLVFKTDKILIFDVDKLSKKRDVDFDWLAGVSSSSVYKVFDKLVYTDSKGVGLIDDETYRKRELYTYWKAREKGNCGSPGETHVNFDFHLLEIGEMDNFNICGYPLESDASFREKRKIKLRFGPVSTAGQYVVSGYRYTLKNLKTSKKYKIAQYPDGEVILFDTSPEKHFSTLTSKAKRHLKMKKTSGDIVPMNDATFDKYRITNL